MRYDLLRGSSAKEHVGGVNDIPGELTHEQSQEWDGSKATSCQGVLAFAYEVI